jgi:ammonium transporter, Amt family
MIQWMKRFKVDDSLDVFACHGVAGAWGAIAVGLFADKALNPAGANGLFLGNISLLHAQVVSVLAASAWSFVVTFLIIKVIDWVHGFCVAPINEEIGLDVTQHGEGVFQLL